MSDVRGAGYFLGTELTRDQQTRERFSDAEADRIRAFLDPAWYAAGLYCRADDRGDVVLRLTPPLTSGPAELQLIEAILRDVLTRAADRV